MDKQIGINSFSISGRTLKIRLYFSSLKNQAADLQ